jgi:hypothetical protein
MVWHLCWLSGNEGQGRVPKTFCFCPQLEAALHSNLAASLASQLVINDEDLPLLPEERHRCCSCKTTLPCTPSCVNSSMHASESEMDDRLDGHVSMKPAIASLLFETLDMTHSKHSKKVP